MRSPWPVEGTDEREDARPINARWRPNSRKHAFAALCLLVATTCSCAAAARRRAFQEFGPAAEGAYQLDLRSYPRELSVGDELLARYVLTNVSDKWVRGCVSANGTWLFTGSRGAMKVERIGSHHTCEPDRRFFLSRGDSHSWLDAVEVPDVGVGETEVVVNIEIVFLEPNGRVDSDRRWEVSRSITVEIHRADPRQRPDSV